MEFWVDFRLVIIGIFIENYLGEFWNLFCFFNFGLLGFQKCFNEKFINLISKGDELCCEQFWWLIQFFILCCYKWDVFIELLVKIEIIFLVFFIELEYFFYEVICCSVLEVVEVVDGVFKWFVILVQFIKFWQVVCYFCLVMLDSWVFSFKFDFVGEIIFELFDSGYKVLVFSQFVKYLCIVEQWVKVQGIFYQYFDGQILGKKWEEVVQVF